MGREVRFDYSKAAGFISQEEIDNMEDAVMGAKKKLVEKNRRGRMIMWVGSTSRLIMIKKSLQGSRKRQKRFREIPMCFS